MSAEIASVSKKVRKFKKSVSADVVEKPKSEHVFLRNVSVGESFSGVYFLEKVFIKVARTGNKYSDLTLRDKSGSIFAKFWGEVTSTTGSDWVEIAAAVEEYQGKPNIIVQSIVVCDAPEDICDYMAVSETTKNDSEALKVLMEAVNEHDTEARCDTCSAILKDVFKNGFASKFEKSPASTYPCYGQVGGLLAYTVRVAKLARDASVEFGLSPQEKSIALTAAILHRVGAIYSYAMVDCVPAETKRGAMVGSLQIGFAWVAKSVNRVTLARKSDDELPNIDDDVVVRLMHAIVASELNGLPPMTREAIALHGSVKTVRELSDASDFISHDTNEHEAFTSYDPITKRRFFKGL